MRIYCILRTKKEKNIKFKGIKMKDNKLCDRDCSKCALQGSFCGLYPYNHLRAMLYRIFVRFQRLKD